MAKDPRHRFASVKEFGEYLRRAHYDDSLAVFDPNKFALRLDTAAEAYQQGNLEFAQELVNELESEGYLTQENDEAAQGWIRLFDGNSHFGWTAGGGDWQISRNELVSDPGVQSWLRSTTSFSDFDLKFEARVTGGTATLLLRADPQSKPAQPGYTLSLNDGTISGVSGAAAATSSPAAAAGILMR